MIEYSIRKTIRKKLDDWFKTINDESLVEDLKNNVMVTGGAITSLIMNEDVNDYDVYIENKEVLERLCMYYTEDLDFELTDKYGEDRVYLYRTYDGVSYFWNNKDKAYAPLVVSSNAITLTSDIQIVCRFFGTPEEIHSNYDFEHCKGIYTYKDDKVHISKEVYECTINKNLRYTGSKYPLASLIRTRKFIKRGYKINAGQYVKMALQLQDFNLKDPEVLSDQLCGVDLFLFEMIINQIKQLQEDNSIKESDYIQNVINIIDGVFQREFDYDIKGED